MAREGRSMLFKWLWGVFVSQRSEKNKYLKELHFPAPNEDRTHDPWFTRPVLCHWAMEAYMLGK